MKETRFKQTEIGLIPEDWKVVTISKIAETSSGGTPSRSINRYYNGTIRWITTSELKDSRIYNSIEHITEEAVQNSSAKLFPKGTILMAMYGATIGKLGILEVCSTTNQACCAIICHDIKNIYLFYYLFFIRREIILQGCGAGQPNISQNIVKNINIGLPEEIEQEKIASALTSIDNLLLSLEKLIEKKRLIKQGAMQDLLTGKKRLPGFTGEWVERQLGEITEMNSGGTPSVNVKEYYGNEIPFLSISDMSWQGKYLKQTEKSITYLGLKNSSARIVPSGTILYAMYASIGKCSIANIELAISQAILGIKVNKEVLNNIYLYYYLSFIENKAKEIGQQGTQSNLSKQIVEKFKIQLPTIKEQQTIATVLSSIDKEIESLEGKKAKYEQIKQGMMQQLLTGKIRLI